MNLLEANSESWRRYDEAIEDTNRKLLQHFLPSNLSREKIDGMEQLEELVRSLQRKENELRTLASRTMWAWSAELEAKANGVKLAREDLQALIKQTADV